jgi:hypothetical protein
MRLLLVAIGSALVLAGCSTEEGLHAQELLQRAEVAQAQLSSSTFEGSMAIAGAGEDTTVLFHGAFSGGAEWISVGAEGFSMQLLVRGGRSWTNLGTGWRAGPAPAASAGLSATAFQQLARYVKDVRVHEHQLVAGKQVTTIAGEIDTEGMIEALSGLDDLAEGFDLDELGVDLGDIHAVLSLDERSGLLDSASVTFTLKAQGEQVRMGLRYRLTSANEPVTLPSP